MLTSAYYLSLDDDSFPAAEDAFGERLDPLNSMAPTSSSAEAFSCERPSTRLCLHILLERIMIFGCASNATALPADMIAVALFISGNQAAA